MFGKIIEATGSLLPVENYITVRLRHLEALIDRARMAHYLATNRLFGPDLATEGETEDVIFFAQVELARLGRMTEALDITLPE